MLARSCGAALARISSSSALTRRTSLTHQRAKTVAPITPRAKTTSGGIALYSPARPCTILTPAASRIMAPGFAGEHDLFGKPAPTFPDHALEPKTRPNGAGFECRNEVFGNGQAARHCQSRPTG